MSGSLRRVSDTARPAANAESTNGGARLALRRRIAFRRSDAPADNTRYRFVRRNIAAAERSAGAIGGAVEVWIQEYQVSREDNPRRRRTADNVEHSGAARIRVIFKRQPECFTPTPDPGDRKAHRRITPTPKYTIQRIRI